jgi:hypothetical protein
MRHDRRKVGAALAGLLLLLVGGAVTLAQTSAGFNLEWHVIGSGGGASSSASYHVNGTIGQSIASQPASASANFVVGSGYWFVDTGTTIYLPTVLRN